MSVVIADLSSAINRQKSEIKRVPIMRRLISFPLFAPVFWLMICGSLLRATTLQLRDGTLIQGAPADQFQMHALSAIQSWGHHRRNNRGARAESQADSLAGWVNSIE